MTTRINLLEQYFPYPSLIPPFLSFLYRLLYPYCEFTFCIRTEGEAAAREEKAKLEQIKKEIKELEKMLKALEAEQNEPHLSVGLSHIFIQFFLIF